MPTVPELVLGTRNLKKRREMEALLADRPLVIRTLDDFPAAVEVAETGDTFAENAGLKATVQARHLNRWVVGEDSGLSVEALGGLPGVRSSRFAGEAATDEQNNEKLALQMRDVPDDRRGAWYTCHMTLSDPDGNPVIDVERTCRGRITGQPRGTAGFGYDPWFEIPEYHQTFGEMGEAVKGILGHRGRAMRAFMRELARLKF
jgi:XTP/dITP diphosphohydrolase